VIRLCMLNTEDFECMRIMCMGVYAWMSCIEQRVEISVIRICRRMNVDMRSCEYVMVLNSPFMHFRCLYQKTVSYLGSGLPNAQTMIV
jgi:hypothetical protein